VIESAVMKMKSSLFFLLTRGTTRVFMAFIVDAVIHRSL